jgi:hypothetical protein
VGIKESLSKPFAKKIVKKVNKWASRPIETQDKVFSKLMKNLAKTQFGKDYQIHADETYESFKKKVPVRDYEGLRLYFDRIANGEANICWPGRPIYLAKTSGTTSGSKYIPITKASIGNHIKSARNALLTYILNSGNTQFVNGKLIFLSGSPVLGKKSGIFTGRLSGISNHHIPSYLKTNQLPSWDTNCIDDWEEKVERIADETIDQDMTLISGIPPWVQMYFDVLQSRTGGKPIKELFPNFSVFVYGGVNFEPYRAKLEKSVGKKVDSIELFPASEGFFAYQNELENDGLLLLLDDGIFYEFIPQDEFHNEDPTRLSIGEVEMGVNYALIINSNAGLWGYSIGDMVKFVSLDPYKVIVSGRIKHFISAFGEHVIGEEVESALLKVSAELGVEVTEFTVAPQVNPSDGLPYHEWLIEFADDTPELSRMTSLLDGALRKKNSYYDDLVSGAVLRELVITPLPKNAFINYMKSKGKLGGQNKVPRLSNDREIADGLLA